jgi:hypothetical protein
MTEKKVVPMTEQAKEEPIKVQDLIDQAEVVLFLQTFEGIYQASKDEKGVLGGVPMFTTQDAVNLLNNKGIKVLLFDPIEKAPLFNFKFERKNRQQRRSRRKQVQKAQTVTKATTKKEGNK